MRGKRENNERFDTRTDGSPVTKPSLSQRRATRRRRRRAARDMQQRQRRLAR